MHKVTELVNGWAGVRIQVIRFPDQRVSPTPHGSLMLKLTNDLFYNKVI